MSNVTISQLPVATSATTGDLLPVQQGGVTKQLSNANLFTNAVLTAPNLGVPVSGNLASCTNLPIATGVSGLGSNVATFLATPSSANLIAAVTGETGTGALVFATAPTLVNPVVTGGSINNTPIGATTANTGKFTTLATNIVTNTAATYTVLATDHTIIQTTAGSTYTLPTASSFTGRQLHIVTQFAGAVISASSNVVPLAGGAAGTAILAATAGKWATLVSNGTSWNIVASN